MNLKLVANDTNAPYVTALIYAETGKSSEAAAGFQELGRAKPPSVDFAVASLWAEGKTSEARLQLDELAKSPAGASYPTIIAGWYARLSAGEAALQWLEKSYAAHDAELPFVKSNPAFTSLRDDPHFQNLLQRMGL